MTSRRNIDRMINDLAAPTLSVVHARSLRANRISPGRVAIRTSLGTMAVMLPRTYAVGPSCHHPTFEMRCMAGVLAGGALAGLDGAAAAHLLGVWDRRVGSIDVTTRGRPPRGVIDPWHFHETASGLWVPDDSLDVGPIRLVSAVCMIARFACEATPWQVAFVIGRAVYLRLVTIDEVRAHAARQARRRGNGTLRAAIRLVDAGSAGTRCRTEDCYLTEFAATGIEAPLVNVRGAMGMSRDEPDFVWLDRRVNVESDGGQHEEPVQAADDALRDQEAAERGFRVLRVRSRDFHARRRRVMRLVVRFVRGEDVPMHAGTRVMQIT